MFYCQCDCYIPLPFLSAITVDELREIREMDPAFFHKPMLCLTQKAQTFYDAIINKLVLSPSAQQLLRTAKHVGYQFAGFTGTASKANTDTRTRLVRIREDLDYETAALSLSYELSNVINAEKNNAIIDEARLCRIGKEEYVRRILLLEAEAILWRSTVADELGLAHLIVNQKYNQIVRMSDIPNSEKIGLILNELKERGRVGRDSIPVVKYYSDRYDRLYGRKC